MTYEPSAEIYLEVMCDGTLPEDVFDDFTALGFIPREWVFAENARGSCFEMGRTLPVEARMANQIIMQFSFGKYWVQIDAMKQEGSKGGNYNARQ